MLGTPAKIFQNLSPSATCCILEPGSVTAMKWLPTLSAPTFLFTCSKKYCLKMFGSSVLPDLLETMQSVFFRSSFFSSALICKGSVESRTCISGKPLILPNVMRRTSGQRLEPPMPSNTTCLNLRFFTSAASSLNEFAFASCSSVTESQPSQLLSSAPVHTEASLAHIRATLLFDFQSLSAAVTADARLAGSLYASLFRLTRTLLRALRLRRGAV